MLQASHLYCLRGDHLVFRDISFELGAGEWMTVLGANGSGKSSLLRLLAGLVLPLLGSVHWQGRDIAMLRAEYQPHMLYIGHQNGLKPELTVMENLYLGGCLAGYGITPMQTRAALRAVGLDSRARTPARVLSQGQQRRLALARLWLAPQVLWLLDEPFAALDADSCAVVRQRLEQHVTEGGMLVLSAHQPPALAVGNGRQLQLGRAEQMEALQP